MAQRTVVAVPLQPAGASSHRRTASAVIVWILGLVGVVAVGIVGQLPKGSNRLPPVDAAEPPEMASPIPNVRRTAAFPAPERQRALGEDGLVGGIVFGDNVPSLSQADIERDGYRYYQQLLARDVSLAKERPH